MITNNGYMNFYMLITSGLLWSSSPSDDLLFSLIRLNAACIVRAASSEVSSYLVPLIEMEEEAAGLGFLSLDSPLATVPFTLTILGTGSESSSSMTGTLIPLLAISFFKI